MAFVSRAANYPDFSSSGQGKFTPVIYAQKTLIKLYKTTVLSDITNTDYEGEIRAKGDKIIIRTVPDIAIKDYVKGQDLVYDTPDSASIEMTVDYAKYYATKIDRIDEVQNDIGQMDKWSDDASQQLKIAVETSFFSGLFGSAAAVASTCATTNFGNSSGLAGQVSTAYFLGKPWDSTNYLKILKTQGSVTEGVGTSNGLEAVQVVLGASSCLSEQNVPETERFIVIPQWMSFQLQTGDLRRADSLGGPDNQDVLRKGKLGMLGNMTIYVSNNLPSDANGTIMPYGHKMALTFATQLTENEMIPHPLAFGKIMRGLQVYGFKSVKVEAVGVAYGKKG